MEGSTPNPEFSPHSKPDFYELVIGRALTDKEIEAHHNTFAVNDINSVLSEIKEHFPEIEVSDIAPTPWRDQLAVIVDPRGNLLFLRQPAIEP